MPRSHAFDKLAGGLAAAFLAGEWSEAGLGRPPARVRQSARHWYTFEQSMGRRRWPVAELDGLDELGAMLGLTEGRARLAGGRPIDGAPRLIRAAAQLPLRLAGAAGRPPRVIERPKARLKTAQRAVLRQILDAVPPHPASHGFVPGRSARTHAAEHSGREVVVRLDLEDFFASVEWAAVPRPRHPRPPGLVLAARAEARDPPPAPGRADIARPREPRHVRG